MRCADYEQVVQSLLAEAVKQAQAQGFSSGLGKFIVQQSAVCSGALDTIFKYSLLKKYDYNQAATLLTVLQAEQPE